MELDFDHARRKKAVKELVRAIDKLEKERQESQSKHADHILRLGDLMSWTKTSMNDDFSDRTLKVRARCFRLQKLEEELRGTSSEVLHLQKTLESLMAKKVTQGSFSEKVLEVNQVCSEFKEKQEKYQQLKMLIEEDEAALQNLSGWKAADGDFKTRCNQVKEQCQKVNEMEFNLRGTEKRILELDSEFDEVLCAPKKVESVSPNITMLRKRYGIMDRQSSVRPVSSTLEDSKDQRMVKLRNETVKPIRKIGSNFSSNESISSSSISTSSSFKYSVGEEKRLERSRELDSGMSSPPSINSEESGSKGNYAKSEKKSTRGRPSENVSKKKWGAFVKFSFFKDKDNAT